MKVSVFGLGYVGCVTIGCLAKSGHSVIGVDTDPVKIDLLNKGKPTIVEKDIDVLIAYGSENGRIEATINPDYAVKNSDITVITVGTPPMEDGHPELKHIFQAAKSLGESIKQKEAFHTVLIRSTVPPGTNVKVAGIIEEISGKLKNKEFGVVSNPEFLREGTAVFDYYHSPYILAGSESDHAYQVAEELYKDTGTIVIRKDVSVCEVIKYVCNSYHALKVAFANEIGDICKRLGTDSHQVMEVFCRDTKLNISPYYFKPGFAYGGSCLPKDLKGLCLLAKEYCVEVPVLEAIGKSNEVHKDIALKMITEAGKRNIGILGLSFKAGTDDLRESPMLDIAERLYGKGYSLRIYDSNVYKSITSGTNRKSIESRIPHLIDLITDDIKDVIENCEVLVIAYLDEIMKKLFNNSDDSGDMPISAARTIFKDKVIIDFIKAAENIGGAGEYHGICW